MFANRLVLDQEVALAVVVKTKAKAVQPAPVHLSISNPVSPVELSVQARLIWEADTAVADKPLGARGKTAKE